MNRDILSGAAQHGATSAAYFAVDETAEKMGPEAATIARPVVFCFVIDAGDDTDNCVFAFAARHPEDLARNDLWQKLQRYVADRPSRMILDRQNG